MEAVAFDYPEVSEAKQAAEVLARMAETGVRPTFLEVLYARIRNALRALGIDLKHTNAELKTFVIDAAKLVRDGKQPRDALGRWTAGLSLSVKPDVLVTQFSDRMPALPGLLPEMKKKAQLWLLFESNIRGRVTNLHTQGGNQDCPRWHQRGCATRWIGREIARHSDGTGAAEKRRAFRDRKSGFGGL